MAFTGAPIYGYNPMMGVYGGGFMPPNFMLLQILELLMMLGGPMGGPWQGGVPYGPPGGGCPCPAPGIGGYPQALGEYLGMPGHAPAYAPPGMPWGNPYTPPLGSIPYNSAGGSRLAQIAASWDGRHFKPGQTKRCADFVSTMIEQSGMAPPGFRHEVSAARLARYGQRINPADLKPGDLVFFGNTYRPGKYTHVGIYLGNGLFAHRPTANKPVTISRLDRGYYAGKFTEARRLPTAMG